MKEFSRDSWFYSTSDMPRVKGNLLTEGKLIVIT